MHVESTGPSDRPSKERPAAPQLQRVRRWLSLAGGPEPFTPPAGVGRECGAGSDRQGPEAALRDLLGCGQRLQKNGDSQPRNRCVAVLGDAGIPRSRRPLCCCQTGSGSAGPCSVDGRSGAMTIERWQPYLTRRECRCSSVLVTHRDVWLLSLFPMLTSYRPRLLPCARQGPPTSAATAASPGYVPNPICTSSRADAPIRNSIRS